MSFKNNTVAEEFILLGLSGENAVQFVLFFVFLTVYITIITANSLIIILIILDSNLHSPMYFFISNLSFLDLCYSSSTVPRLLRDLMSLNKIISFAECGTQMYFSLSLGASECILLAVMAYDRYIAICYPLHYNIKVSKTVCIRLACGTWATGFLITICNVIMVLNVNLCGNNKINHFVCEVTEILSLRCESILTIELVIYFDGVFILMIPVAFIMVTYLQIIVSILEIVSSAGRRKAFSTCGSHLIVVIIFYGSAIATYMKPRATSLPGTDRLFAVFYLIVTPMLNPLIYSLKNKDIKRAFYRLTNKILS
ncbi:olfactory receptor 5V1-like [Pyxicephalus adspersus]|uniref:Olfactory receptor n=1 Tax=Pyxicephalus adspersus TaxID=30357 RepID=A0AAV3A6Z2_PYXAD|nr:TPA: hypothetical protein GDO54_015832 [Pyxicephalus adspersus]